jgi:hypothetical protein
MFNKKKHHLQQEFINLIKKFSVKLIFKISKKFLHQKLINVLKAKTMKSFNLSVMLF